MAKNKKKQKGVKPQVKSDPAALKANLKAKAEAEAEALAKAVEPVKTASNLDDEDIESANDLGGKGDGEREYFYNQALAKAGISRDSAVYQTAVEAGFLWLRSYRTFYSFLIDEMSRRVTHKVATASVHIEGVSIVLRINPDFFALLPLRKRAGVIMHECLHVIALHITRTQQAVADHGRHVLRYANIACDLAVNSLLADPRDLPDSAWMPNKLRVPVEGKAPTEWPQFEARHTFEYYLKLLRQMTPEQMQQQMMGIGVGDGIEPDGGWDSDAGSILVDDHDIWEMSATADAETLNEIVRAKMRNANNRARSRGLTPGDCAEILEELIAQPSVNFAAVFQGLIGRYLCQVRQKTMMRPSKRYPAPPGRIMGRRLDVRYYQDTSGSMATDEVTIGISEAVHAERTGQAHVTLQQFDAALQGPPRPISDIGRAKIEVHGRGGTSLAPVIEDIDKTLPDLAIIATDGGLEHDIKPKHNVPVVWILTHDGHAPPWGQIVRLPSRADIERGERAKAIRKGMV